MHIRNGMINMVDRINTPSGFDSSNYQSSVERLDPRMGRWMSVPSMSRHAHTNHGKKSTTQFAISYETCTKPAKGIVFDEDGISSVSGLIKQFGTKDFLPKFVQLNTQ